MAFSKDDKVRFGSCKEFAVVLGKHSDNIRYVIKIAQAPGETITDESSLVADYALPVGEYCYVKGEKKTYLKIANCTPVPTPKASDSNYMYTVQKSDGSNPHSVNGKLIYEVTPIAEPGARAEFFTALNNRLPFVFIPQEMREKGFVLAFRGDDRGTEEIFRDGFKPRQEFISVMYRGKEADLFSVSGVCASLEPAAGGLFPLYEKDKNPQVNTFLYVFIAYQHFETFRFQEQQAKDATQELRAKIQEMIQGQEIAIGREGVQPKTILGAYPVKRTWLGKDWRAGCTYTVMDYIENASSFYYCTPDADQTETDVERHRKHLVDAKVRGMTKSPVFNLPD